MFALATIIGWNSRAVYARELRRRGHVDIGYFFSSSDEQKELDRQAIQLSKLSQRALADATLCYCLDCRKRRVGGLRALALRSPRDMEVI